MSESNAIQVFKAGDVSLSDLRTVYLKRARIELDESAWENIRKGQQAVEKILADNRTVYGINTGFGLLAHTRVPDDQLEVLQRNLVLSHAAGVGEDLSPETVRLIMVLKVLSLSQGHSGVREVVIKLLLGMINAGVTPAIPMKGSVGASGDLAPLAHMTCCMIGEGRAYVDGEKVPAVVALKKKKLQAIALQAKEGLALLNGTQTSTALALIGLFKAEHLFSAAVVCGALSVEGLKGSYVPFDDRIHRVRKQRGQIEVAGCFRHLFKDSGINASHINCDKVQDPYSLRCQPQVMGAVLDMLHYASHTLLLEANAVTDNPLIFDDGHTQDALSGGNFHAEPIAMVSDTIALAIAEIASISERRLSILVDPKMSELPPFLVENSGINSGFMIAQVSAAALVSENKSLAHPASVDSIPTSANQEDHVSMATYAARRLQDMSFNAMNVIAIELLAAAQAVEFLRPLHSSAQLESVISHLRQQVEPLDKDRYFASDIDKAYHIVQSGYFYDFMQNILPSTAR